MCLTELFFVFYLFFYQGTPTSKDLQYMTQYIQEDLRMSVKKLELDRYNPAEWKERLVETVTTKMNFSERFANKV